MHLDAGRQAYVVCPLIEQSETRLARAAEAEADRLRRAELKGYRVGLLHGKLKTADRREVMRQFKEGELDVLVATTVIEVGVDVPNATIMIVQEADRFGLAQLHQLRGRVGRGAEQSYCLLISRDKLELTDVAKSRLEALVKTTDGFELAEVDLELRGEGQLLGTRQSGWSDLRFTKLRVDRDLIERARALANELRDEDGPWQDAADRLGAIADRLSAPSPGGTAVDRSPRPMRNSPGVVIVSNSRRQRGGDVTHAGSDRHPQGVLRARERRRPSRLEPSRPVLRELARVPRRLRPGLGHDLRRRRERVARLGHLAQHRSRRDLGALLGGPRLRGRPALLEGLDARRGP